MRWKVGGMKPFYSAVDVERNQDPYGVQDSSLSRASAGVRDCSSYIGTRARVAVYDAPAAAPYVEDVGPAPAGEFIDILSSRVYELARRAGGEIPYTVVREVAENLIHADFCEPVVSVLDSGRTIRFSDQGPGFSDRERALEPGFTTARDSMKSIIRGVGSGLPIVKEFLSLSGGRLVVEDNLSQGAVVTLCAVPKAATQPGTSASSVESPATPDLPPDRGADSLFSPPAPAPGIHLTNRQKQVLALVLESGAAGPSLVSRELGVGLSTAYRDLAFLEDLGLIAADGGKRTLTDQGSTYLSAIMASDY